MKVCARPYGLKSICHETQVLHPVPVSESLKTHFPKALVWQVNFSKYRHLNNASPDGSCNVNEAADFLSACCDAPVGNLLNARRFCSLQPTEPKSDQLHQSQHPRPHEAQRWDALPVLFFIRSKTFHPSFDLAVPMDFLLGPECVDLFKAVSVEGKRYRRIRRKILCFVWSLKLEIA